MSSSDVLQIELWSEIVGAIQAVGEVYVVVEAVRRYKIPREAFTPDQVERLREGAEVGILFRDDGPTIVREISPAQRDRSTVVRLPTSDRTEF